MRVGVVVDHEHVRVVLRALRVYSARCAGCAGDVDDEVDGERGAQKLPLRSKPLDNNAHL